MPRRKRNSARSASRSGKRRIRYAVVGLGHIAQVAVLPAFRLAAENSELAALVSDDPVKRDALARFPKRDSSRPSWSTFPTPCFAGKNPEPSGREGLADIRVTRALLQSAESRRPVRLDEFERRRRPVPSQEIRKPPVSKPRLIHVEAPSEG